ncbi:MAG: Brp/Blh family beta-carotene 15,15'-dioxygenase [Pseudomonadota bacterium]
MTTTPTHLTTRERLAFFELPILVLLIFVLVEMGGIAVSWDYTGWPLVISTFVVGMPHGAADFMVATRRKHSATTWSKLLAFSRYSLLLLASASLAIWQPTWALTMFLFVSACHFGLADARDLGRRTGSEESNETVLIAAFGRGVLLVAAPIVFQPQESLDAFARVLAIFGEQPLTATASTARAFAAGLLMSAFAAQTLVTLIRWRRMRRSATALDLIEVVVLTAAFATLHPLFAIGLYLLAWHGWRHLHTLAKFFASTGDGENRGIIRQITQMHWYSLPLLIPTLVVYLVVAVWRLENWSADNLAALTIASFVIVTLPHHVLVEGISRFLRRRSGKKSQTAPFRGGGNFTELTRSPSHG